MDQELRAEELRHATDRHIASVTSPDGQRRTTNEAICGEFRQYFLKLFTREPGLSSAQFDSYLADFPRLSAIEAAGCEGRIKEEEIRDALKSVGLDKSPGIDGLPCEVYLRLLHMCVPLLATIYNNWMRQGTIPRRFTRGIVKLLRKNKHGGDGISNFRPLTMLNTDLKILAKILANRLQTVLPSLISPEQTCAVKAGLSRDSLHLVRTIVEKVDGNAALINLDQSKAFDRVDHAFLEAVLSSACFGVDTSPLCVPRSHGGGEWGKVGVLHSDSIDSSRLLVIAHAIHPCARAFSAQAKGEAGPTRPHITWRQ